MQPILAIRDFFYAYPGASGPCLRELNLAIMPGECHVLSGPTGSGKSTLLLAIRGLLPEGHSRGTIGFPALKDGDPAAGVGIVLQNPETQLLRATAGAEVAFGLESLGLAPSEMPDRVRAALEAVGFHRPLGQEVRRLSMGQKYRVLLAAFLVMEARLLLLDEPGAQLDPEGLANLLNVIAELKTRGVAVLIAEHAPWRFAAVTDGWWRLNAEGALQRLAALSDGGVRPVPAAGSADVRAITSGPEVVQVRKLTLKENPRRAIVGGLDLTVQAGERLIVWGPNGSGKTTLLRCLTGFLRPDQGTVAVLGHGPRPRELRGRVGLLFQNPHQQLFENTVMEEVAFSLRRLRAPAREIPARVADALAGCGISDLAAHSPHQLSYGQRHLVALAALLAADPQLLLLDDPFAGLDPACGAAILGLLRQRSEERGTAVVWTTHNPDRIPRWGHAGLRLGGPVSGGAWDRETASGGVV